MNVKVPVFAALAAAFFAAHAHASTIVQDGFESASQTKSRFFTIHLQSGVDPERLAMKIAVPAAAQSIVSSADFSAGSSLEDQIDMLYLVVSEILQSRVSRFESTAKICEGQDGLSGVSSALFGRPVKTGGFYVVAVDTLYVDSENIDLYVLGHEIAHAVISKYFVVPPPEKIQEVLAGYVEFELRKLNR